MKLEMELLHSIDVDDDDVALKDHLERVKGKLLNRDSWNRLMSL